MGRKFIRKKLLSEGQKVTLPDVTTIKLYIGLGSAFIIHIPTQSTARVKHCLLTDILPTPLLFNVCNL